MTNYQNPEKEVSIAVLGSTVISNAYLNNNTKVAVYSFGSFDDFKKLDIRIAKVLSVENHPNADKLKVCRVDIGSDTVQIVCGGSNVAAGMMVAAAKVGAKVKWHGEGDLVELSPVKIRGVESFGMICGADEIGLLDRFPKKEEKEIVDLSALKLKAGAPLAEALKLDDVILEIDNKSLSNRPDLWGHYGLAREVAALTNRAIQPYQTKKIIAAGVKKGSGVNLRVRVENQAACPKYMAVAMSGVKVGPSPVWLKEKLAAVGVRSINNIVDATNFVMFDLGQPMHAFDRKIIGDEIVARSARSGESITTLDEKERQLTPSPVSWAGWIAASVARLRRLLLKPPILTRGAFAGPLPVWACAVIRRRGLKKALITICVH